MRKSQEDKKRELIDGILIARSSILDLVQRLSPEQLNVAFLGEWSVKDLVAHLAGWDITNLQAIQEISQGIYPSFFEYYDKDWRTYNARLVAAHKVEPFEALLVKLDDSHRRLVTHLESLPASVILNGKASRANGRSVTIRNLLKAEAVDEREHAMQIREFFV